MTCAFKKKFTVQTHAHKETNRHRRVCTTIKSTLIKARLSPTPPREETEWNQSKCFNSHPPLWDTSAWQNSQVILIRLWEHHVPLSLPSTYENEEYLSPLWQSGVMCGERVEVGALPKQAAWHRTGFNCTTLQSIYASCGTVHLRDDHQEKCVCLLW